MRVSDRSKALGNWGEQKALMLLKRAGFELVRDLNTEMANHPFADAFAARDPEKYIVGVRTRNKYTAAGPLNSPYNVCTKGVDLSWLESRYDARLACLALQVDVEAQLFSAFFATLAQVNELGIRYSIPMTAKATARYECLARNEHDPSIRPEWTNQKVLLH